MPTNSRQGKVRPSEVAADTKRHFIPMINAQYSQLCPLYSVLYRNPTMDLEIHRRTYSIRPPSVTIETGDPVSRAIEYGMMDQDGSQVISGAQRINIPFICAANERRAGGDWETGCSGYEEKLCRRSNLSATLNAPWPDTSTGPGGHYPIPSGGGVLSKFVFVHRGPAERYDRLDRLYNLPVVSVPPTRWPKLKDNGTKYSFAEEREMMQQKIRGALRICLFHGYDRIVIGDFGLGNGHRNPPQEVAEIWRDILLFDPNLRGQFSSIVFVFENPNQSTSGLILDELAKKDSKHSGGTSRSKHRPSSSSSSSSRGSNIGLTDQAIFERVFDSIEVERVLRKPDPRYGLDMITL